MRASSLLELTPGAVCGGIKGFRVEGIDRRAKRLVKFFFWRGSSAPLKASFKDLPNRRAPYGKGFRIAGFVVSGF